MPRAGDFGIEHRVELGKNLRHRRTPFRIARIAIQKIHLLQSELSFGKGALVHSHLALGLPQWLK